MILRSNLEGRPTNVSTLGCQGTKTHVVGEFQKREGTRGPPHGKVLDMVLFPSVPSVSTQLPVRSAVAHMLSPQLTHVDTMENHNIVAE